jgi:hypothetical protein
MAQTPSCRCGSAQSQFAQLVGSTVVITEWSALGRCVPSLWKHRVDRVRDAR